MLFTTEMLLTTYIQMQHVSDKIKVFNVFRVQKEAMRQTSIQLEKEGEQKVEKLNNQMDGIIRRTDKEIKNLKNEEANLKKMISERDEVGCRVLRA